MAGKVVQRQNAKRGRKGSNAPVLLLILLLIATSGALLWAALGQSSLSGREFLEHEGLDPRAAPLSQSLFARFGEENPIDQLSYQVNQSVELSSQSSAAPLCIGNPIQNGVLLQAEVILDQTGETVFSSGFLLPGSGIESALLSGEIQPGEHEATVWFYAADPENQALLGRVSEPITIKVLS